MKVTVEIPSALRRFTDGAGKIECEGANLQTVEGLAPPGELNILQKAFNRHHALQCGFCTAGILISATQFLAENPEPTESEVTEMLSGHLCRCTGYYPIVAAILDAAGELRNAKPIQKEKS